MSNIRVTTSASAANARSESVVVVNPNDRQQIVASSKKFINITNYEFTLATSYSTDGGQTWKESAALTLPGDATIMSDPALAWDDAGNIFLMGLLGKNPPTPDVIGMVMYKSTDGGKTWSSPKSIHTSASDDKQWIAGDTKPDSPHRGNVYAVWDDGDPAFGAPMRFARTLDQGATWIGLGASSIKDAVLAPDSFSPEISVAADGTIYVVYINGEFGGVVKFIKSTDGGETFSTPAVVASGISGMFASFPLVGGYAQFPGGKFRMVTLATGCTGPGDNLSVAWADGREGSPGAHQSRIYYRRSPDGGNTWLGPASGQPLLTSPIPANFQHFHPQLICDANGVIGCAFYEFGPKPTTPLIDVIMAQSLDGGATFVPFRVTDRAWDPALGAPLARGDNNVTFIGEYFGFDASFQGFHTVWTDTRVNDTQELWTDIVPVKRCAFIVERSTFGQDEIDARRGQPGGPVVPEALRVVVDGLTAAQLGLSGPSQTLNVVSPIAGMAINCTGNTSATGGYGPEIQRFTFNYNIDFGPTDTAFGFTDPTLLVTLNVSIAGLVASAQIELIKQPNPFILHGDPGWLSVDLRVFSVVQGQKRFGVTMGSSASAAPAFIQQVMANLTAGQGTAGGETFDDDLPVEEEENLFVMPTTGPFGFFRVFNFALAKVHYVGLIGATNVRVFFRMFQAQSTNTAFQPATTYRRALSNPDGQPIPLAGILDGEYVTIPFFATARINSTTVSMDQQTDTPNIQTITPGTGGEEVDHFFGCWLDLNQPSNKVLPVETSGTNVDGPFTDSANPPRPIQQAILRNPHQCFVAEIAFDPVVIPVGKTPYDWDKLAQRNLAWSDIPNPGVDGSRTALDTFEIRPTPAGQRPDQAPDELMIDWGRVPAGSVASIYLPGVNVDEVLAMAAGMYTTHRLSRVDNHTLQCPTGGMTYIPVPAGTGSNYAGLLSIDLPATVKRGQEFNVVVRQVTNASGPAPVIIFAASDATGPAQLEWRRVLGAFQLTIPVSTKGLLLEREERLLSVLRWIAEAIPADSRWYPVFVRYLDLMGGRVTGLGGDPDQISPSPDGNGRVDRCDRKLRWLVPLLLAFMLVLIALAPLIWAAPLAAATIVLVVAAAFYWYWRCKATLCDFLGAFILGIGVAYLVLGLVVLLGYRSVGLLLMLALLGVLSGVLLIIAVVRGCCRHCAEKHEPK